MTSGETVHPPHARPTATFPTDDLARFWASHRGLRLLPVRAWGLPLVHDGHVLRSAGGEDFPAVFASPTAAPFDAPRLRGRVAGLVLHDVADEGGMLAHLRQCVPKASVYSRYECPVAEFGDDVDAYLRATLSKSRRKKLRRDRRKLEDFGALTLGWVTREDVDPMFARFFALIAQRAAHTGMFDRNLLRREYLHGIWRAFVGRELEVSVLCIDGEPVSFRSGFVVGERFVGFLPAFDRSFGSIGVGHVHLSMLLPELVQRGIRVYDFGKGTALGSKEVWETRRYTLSTVVVPLSGSVTARARRGLEGAGERARAAITHRGWAEPLRRTIHWGLVRKPGAYRHALDEGAASDERRPPG